VFIINKGKKAGKGGALPPWFIRPFQMNPAVGEGRRPTASPAAAGVAEVVGSSPEVAGGGGAGVDLATAPVLGGMKPPPRTDGIGGE